MSKASKAISLALMAIPSLATTQTLCFASASGGGSATRLQLSLPAAGMRLAFIRYEKGTGEVPLVRLREVVVASNGAAPPTVEAIFNEFMEGKTTGQYFLTTSGGAVGDLVYVRAIDGKRFLFHFQPTVGDGQTCNWSGR